MSVTWCWTPKLWSCAFVITPLKGSYHQFKAALTITAVHHSTQVWILLSGIDAIPVFTGNRGTHPGMKPLPKQLFVFFPWIVSDSSEASEELICKPKWSKTFRCFHLEISVWGHTGFVTTLFQKNDLLNGDFLFCMKAAVLTHQRWKVWFSVISFDNWSFSSFSSGMPLGNSVLGFVCLSSNPLL